MCTIQLYSGAPFPHPPLDISSTTQHTAREIQLCCAALRRGVIMAGGVGLRPPKLTLEEYLDFIHSQKQLDLTVHHLNQIIDMHGFKKIHKTTKSVLMEAVRTMELMDPSRSTVGDLGVSSDAFITLNELVKDIDELKWQECCITSLQTINAENHQQLQQQISNTESTALTVASASSAKPKRPRKKSEKLVDGGPGCDLPLTSFEFGGSLTAPCSSLVAKWVPRKKRGMENKNLNGIGNNGDAGLGGCAFAVAEIQPLSSASSAFLQLRSNSIQ